MKKRSPAPHLWKKKVALLLTAVVFVFSVLKLHAQFKSHLTSDYRYLNQPYSGKPKIAFLFLVRNRLPLDFVWQRFFQGAEEPVFSIYIHSKPGFVFNQFTTTCTFCYDRQLEESIQVDWGEASMIEAERILLRKALQDPANQRFILVSDSCVPLYNFSLTYNYVMSSSKSFVDSFLDTKGGRYNPKMAPTIPKDKWRKGSQWFTLTRKHAVVMEVDNTIFPIFKRHCKRRPPLPEFLRKQVVIGVVQKEHNCIPDEHYVQTLLAMRNLEQELERRTLTYTLWNQTAKEIEMQGWHPVTFKHADVDAGLVENIKSINHVYYETEYRIEWCSSNEKRCPCFLFARKFSRGAAIQLLSQVNFDHHFRLDTDSKLELESVAKVNGTGSQSNSLPVVAI